MSKSKCENELENMRSERDHWKRAARANFADMAALAPREIAALLGGQGFITTGGKTLLLSDTETSRTILDQADQQKLVAYNEGRKAGIADSFASFDHWIAEAHLIDVAFVGVINFISGVCTLLYGRHLRSEQVIGTFQQPHADLVDVLSRGDIYNRRFQAAFGCDGIDLSKAYKLYDLLANTIASAKNGGSVDSERLLEALVGFRHIEIINRMAIIRATNKPGRREETATGYIVARLAELESIYPTWRRRAEIIIDELQAFDYRTPTQDEALKTLLEARRADSHAVYVKDTFHNAKKREASEGLIPPKFRVKGSTTPKTLHSEVD